MVRIVVFNATFNNIFAISWRSVLLVEETGVPGENHRPVASNVRGHVYVWWGIDFASFDDNRLALGTVPTVWYYFFFKLFSLSLKVALFIQKHIL
jgi:hypothetical protein